jgi:excisionase family DNA binding protein
VTDDEIAALTPLLLPYREQFEAAWAGRNNPAWAKPNVAPDLLDVPTVAARLSCSKKHVYNLISAGELARRDISLRGRAKTRVPAASVDDYIRRGMRPV